MSQRRISEVQQDARQIDLDPRALRTQATSLLNDGVDTVSKEPKARRAAVEARITDLQKSAQALLEGRELTYSQLVNRGETLVQRSVASPPPRRPSGTPRRPLPRRSRPERRPRRVRRPLVERQERAKSATSTAKNQANRPKSSAKATGTAARKTTSSAARATKDAAAKVGD